MFSDRLIAAITFSSSASQSLATFLHVEVHPQGPGDALRQNCNLESDLLP
jgi:hypothetical protein